MRRRKLFLECLEDRRVLTADFSGNGIADTPDFNIWKIGFGTVNTATQSTGDANGDMDADGADFLEWQRTFGSQIPPLGTSVNISIDGLSEALEVTPGAIVFRNSDFSKSSLATSQPEVGLPLYVPDYAAPATVYDPNAGADFTSASVNIGAGMVGQYTMQFIYDTAKVELWTTTNWGGFEAVAGRFKIPSGITVTPNSATLNFQIEGLQNSTAFSADSIAVQAIPNAGGPNLTDQAIYTVVETNAAVDGNRDTAIDFTNSHDRQLLFWVNNDQEGFHPTDTTVEAEQPNITAPDHADNIIDQRRDLEDLAPLRLNVAPLLFNNAQDVKLGAVPTGQLSARYSLDFLNADGESFRLFYANNSTADVYRHVNNETTASVQATDPTFRNSERAAFTGNHILESMLQGLNPHLFEIRHGTLPYGIEFQNDPILTFVTEVFYPNGNSVDAIDLDIRDIQSFYTRWEIPYEISATDLRTDLTFEHYATPAAPRHSSTVQNVPFFSGDDTTVFVHGWNMTDGQNNDWKAAFAETMFKRLYWQGYRGEFVSFDWPTFADEEGPREWPVVGTGANLTFNPSDIQAYRSARALKEILEDYRQPENLQPVHLLAHSMGNQVASEALRQWAVDPVTVDPLVTNYIAMQAAISAGAYGNNAIDSAIGERPITDLYRFFQHGRDGFSDPGLGITPYYQANGFSSENRINYYNEQDFALDLWDDNNTIAKDRFLLLQSTVWPFDYEFEAGDGDNINNDIFTRVPDVGAEVILDLALPNGRPGPNAYEILSFFAQSASLALGTKEVVAFDDNFDLETLGMLGGSDIRSNHAFQFNHDAAETWGFYTRLKADLDFDATHSVLAIAPSIVATVTENSEAPAERLDWFTELPTVSARVERPAPRDRSFEEVQIPQRLVSIDAVFNAALDYRGPEVTIVPAEDLPDTLDIVFESLMDG